MKSKFKNVLPEIEYFWVEQKNNFYFGMVLCMLFVLNFPLWIPNAIGLALSPVLSVLMYLLIWLFNCKKKPEKYELIENIGMVLSGSLWTLFFALL